MRSVFSSLSFGGPTGVDFHDDGDRLVLRASAELTGLSGGIFAEPQIGVDLPLDDLAGAVLLGHGYTQFAMPMVGALDRPFDLNPASNVFSPPAVLPLAIWLASGSYLLLAPLEGWHDQVIGVTQTSESITRLRWGWHGDIDELQPGDSISISMFEGEALSECHDAWAAHLRSVGSIDRHRDEDILDHLSYWTDNGAAYWYRTEPGRTIVESIEAKITELDELGVPIGAVELDSWFYPHEVGRNVSEIGYLDEVPPTGMLEWKPRADVVPNGVGDVARRVGDRPLILHSRHISAASPYVDDESAWWVELTAHPKDPGWFERWFADAAAWGATCIEQDWMLLYWFGSRPLRAMPGRGLAWLRGLNDAAERHDMSLIFCMSTPGDLCAISELDRVIAVRTCDDYRFADDPARLWRWYLTNNRLARAIDVPVFKDCFFSSADAGSDSVDGDPHAVVEAVLSAFSAGPAGIGDRLGRTDVDQLAPLLAPDGRLASSETSIALCDVSFFDGPDDGVITWADAHDGAWRYLLALHLDDATGPLSGSFELDGERLVYDWRTRTAAPAGQVHVTLEPRDWALFVVCPLSGPPGDRTAVIGDPERYATMSRRLVGPGPDLRADLLVWHERTGLSEAGD